MNSPARGNRSIRDAIVMSGWTWEAFNVPERIALAFSQIGSKVLYCENPVSLLRHRRHVRQEVEGGIYRVGLGFLGHRLNRIPVMPWIQSKLLASQILRHTAELGLENPLLVYPHGDFAALCSEFKKKGFSLIHICMDYPEVGQETLIQLSDLTLLIPKSLYAGMKNRYGDKIHLIPQVTRLFTCGNGTNGDTSVDAAELQKIPRPRLGYVGPVDRRVDLEILNKLLIDHPEWQFVHFGASKCLPLNNVHVLSWRSPEKLKAFVAQLDVGFMPYARDDNKNLNCMPLKLLDYFAQGVPVVSTRILNLAEFSDTIYFGDDAGELSHAVQSALDEPAGSPLKDKRTAIAQANSIEALADVLVEILERCRQTAYAPAT